MSNTGSAFCLLLAVIIIQLDYSSLIPVDDSLCYDRIDNCHSYEAGTCSEFPQWANQNCRRFCNRCGDSITCKDKLSNCDDYPNVCAPEYEDWALENCRQFCSRCGS